MEHSPVGSDPEARMDDSDPPPFLCLSLSPSGDLKSRDGREREVREGLRLERV